MNPTAKRGLGRGLGALIPSASGSEPDDPSQLPGSSLLVVSIDAIAPNPRQPRASMPEDALAQLAASIEEHGVLQPLIVSRSGDGYQLIAGERRWRAAQRAGLRAVPVIVKEVAPQELLELALVENIQRADLNALEEAQAYRHLIDEFGLTQDQVARRVGKSRSEVGNIVRLLALAEPVKAALIQGDIRYGHARALLALEQPDAQAAALQTVLAKALSVRETEELVQRWLGAAPSIRKPQTAVAPEVRQLEERLVAHLGTRVQVKHGKRGGRLVIRYFSDEELNAVCDRILGRGWGD